LADSNFHVQSLMNHWKKKEINWRKTAGKKGRKNGEKKNKTRKEKKIWPFNHSNTNL